MQLDCFYICRMKSQIKLEWLDRIGMTASLACAIHCAALPLILTALPVFGLEFFADVRIEIFMISLSLVIGTWAITRGIYSHKSVIPLGLLLLGFTLISSGHFLVEDYEFVMVPIGGLIVAAAHYMNWHLNRLCTNCSTDNSEEIK